MEISHHFIEEVKKIIDDSRIKAIRSVDHIRVRIYWELGRKIVEEENRKNEERIYRQNLIKKLSVELLKSHGTAFKRRELERHRQFYRTFPIASALRTQLGWTHYKLLLSIENQSKREFYEVESAKNNWTSRQLERQINSSLFERLLLSNKPAS